MSWHGDKASEALDNWRPKGITGKIVKGVAVGARAVDRAAGRDPYNATGGDPYRCHMRARRNGRECNAKLDTRKKVEQGHCGNHICAKEYTEYTSHPDYNMNFDTTRRHMKRW